LWMIARQDRAKHLTRMFQRELTTEKEQTLLWQDYFYVLR
jgi:hypothetical protein